MSAFSTHHHRHLSFSVSPSVPTTSATSSLPGQEIIIQTPCQVPLSPIYPNKTTHDVPLNSASQLLYNSSIHKHCVIKAPADYCTKLSVAPRSHCSPSSMVVVELDDQNIHLEEKKKKRKLTSCKLTKEGKCKRGDKSDCGGGMKRTTNGEKKGKRKASEEVMPTATSTGYVFVRARRGQATDSHSLAERVRREKISQRMRLLQSLVPGCDKITGKALILDEIINYVQSLQNQVEFLIMKIASLYPMPNGLGIATPESENFYGIGTASQCVPETDRDHLIDTTAISQEWPDISTSSLLQQENPCNFFPQDTGNCLWEMEDQIQSIANACEFNSLYCSF